MKTTYVIAVVVILLAAGLGSYAYVYEQGQNNGNMSLSVADLSITGVSAVYIKFSEVALHKAPANGSNSNTPGGWSNYSVSTRTIDILNVTTSNAAVLGNIALSTGTYTMIKLYITSVTVTISGVNYTFKLMAPYAFINHPFTISAHSTTNVMIDFNLVSDMNITSKVFTPNVGIAVS